MKKKNYLKLYTDELNAIEFLSDSVAGKVIKSVAKYVRTGASPHSNNEAIQSLFEMIKNHIDEDRDAYNLLCKKYSENAKKRYAKADVLHSNPTAKNTCNGTPLQSVENASDEISNVTKEPISSEIQKTEEPQDDTSFEHLWKVYNHPKSDRHRAELAWSIFSKDEKKVAIAYIPKYRIECAKERYFPYLAMYLGKKPWQCDGKMK